MGRINIRLDDKTEIEIKRLAAEQKQTLSDYCRAKILGGVSQEQPLSRASIESEIDALKNVIGKMNNNLMSLSKILLKQSKLNSELSNAFLLLALNGDEAQQLEIYKNAENEAENLIKYIFN